MSTTTPQSVDELCDSLSDASARAHSVQIRGGGTRSRRGRPLEPDRVLSTDGLSGLIDYEPADMTVTVQAGTTVELLQHELESRRQAWPHADARPGSTVGGVLASGASGLARLRYGPVRDSLLQVVIVTGDGRRVSAGARTVKSVAGYDLPRLMVGADGTLGVIVQATLRLWPAQDESRWFRLDGSIAELSEHADRAVRDPTRPIAVVLTPGALWVHAVGEGPQGDFTEVAGGGPGHVHGRGIVRVGVPAPAVARAVAALAADGLDHRAQAGVGTIDVAVEEADDIGTLRALASSLGGHAVVVDGPPELRADPFGPLPPGVEIMRRLRNEFDPAGVLNPGLLPWRQAA
jgi:glycolate oxidase FAD binding subunit